MDGHQTGTDSGSQSLPAHENTSSQAATDDPIVATLRDRQAREREITLADRYGNRYIGRVTTLDDGLVTITAPNPYYGRTGKEWTLRVADVVSVQDGD